MSRPVLIALLVIPAVTPGCNSSNDQGLVSTATLDQTCTLDAQAYCGKRMTCWPDGMDDFRFQRDWGTPQGCIDQRKATCMADLQRKYTGLSVQRTTGCAQALQQQTCPDFLAGLAVPASQCPAAGPGQLENGAACAVSGQCRSGYCDRAENQVCGACADRGGIGKNCDQNADCVSPLVCTIESGATSGSCMMAAPAAMRSKAGDPCGTAGQAACDTGLVCVGTGMARTCQAQRNVSGAPCDATRKMAPDCDGALFLSCNRMTSICERQKLVEVGQPCADLPDGSFAVCRSGANCVRPRDPTSNARPAAGTCVADVGENMPCARNAADGPGCAASLRCVYDAVGAPMGRCHAQDLALCGVTASPDGGRD
jgi:hypothetical protein